MLRRLAEILNMMKCDGTRTMISLTQLGQPLRLTRFPPALCRRGYVRPFDREAKFPFVGSTELNAGFHSGKVNRVLLLNPRCFRRTHPGIYGVPRDVQGFGWVHEARGQNVHSKLKNDVTFVRGNRCEERIVVWLRTPSQNALVGLDGPPIAVRPIEEVAVPY
jgi:hypothetical protein